eukprot:CAMPEP_0184451496 /NCGR_PEP_ID=MMETSP0740-20130409/6478_1 /TAXON_ID=385413 /ORGANISM="Thalassiosira miniscula, Strain CCMP1093" /LENGTH=173 /DNA_ID=CAMNT_0026822009 /DNA_START=205 /DNA_END=724 /DNA_ORIENTATION=-
MLLAEQASVTPATDFNASLSRGNETSLRDAYNCMPSVRQASGRVDVSEPASISSGIAERYAAAVFEIAQENNALSELETSIDGLGAALADSAELVDLINSPLISREEQGAAISAVAKKMGVQDVLVNVLGLMAEKRRLFVLPQLIEQLQAMIAENKGEVTADVTTAKALTKTQ